MIQSRVDPSVDYVPVIGQPKLVQFDTKPRAHRFLAVDIVGRFFVLWIFWNL